MASLSSISQRLWDPQDALEIKGLGRCMGITTRKERCKLSTGGNCDTASAILERLSREEPCTDEMESQLHELARACCCNRWHYDQAESIFQSFFMRLRTFERTWVAPVSSRRRRPASSTPRRQTRAARNEESTTDQSRNNRPSRVTLLQLAQEADELQRENEELQEERDDLEAQVARLESLLAADRAEKETLLREKASLQEDKTALRRENAAVSAQNAGLQREVDQLRCEASGLFTDEDNILGTNPSQTPTCDVQHVPRRLLDEPCGICMESMNDNPAHELVWCKAECGKSIHLECFEAWEANRDADMPLRCTHCRADWGPSCSHDNIIPSAPNVDTHQGVEHDDTNPPLLIVSGLERLSV